MIILFLLLSSLRANDGVAGITTQGLVFQQSSSISMEKEELFISLDKIRVSYHFKNLTNKDIDQTVAFPLPPICGMDNIYPVNIENKNPVKFDVKVDGKAVDFKVDKKKYEKNELTCYDFKYYWTTRFLKGKIIHIEHSYNTIAQNEYGAFFEKAISDHAKKKHNPDFNDFLKKYCIEPSLISALEKKVLEKEKGFPDAKQAEHFATLLTHKLEYVLTTANTWKGPIEDFRLVIEKPSADSYVSLCWDGLKKISSTQFEWASKKFKPTKNLEVLFISPFNGI